LLGYENYFFPAKMKQKNVIPVKPLRIANMMADTDTKTQKKYYAVKVGRNSGIFNTWAECSSQVSGFSGAVFKSFSSLQDAQEFLGAPKKLTNARKLDVYTDGSHKNGLLGIGAWCEYEGHEHQLAIRLTKEFLLDGYGADIANCSNVTAEFIAVVEVIKRVKRAKWAIGVNVLNICSDYIGPEKWLSGEWKINNAEIKKIYNTAKESMKEMAFELEFHHIPGHTNSPGNTKADSLASCVMGIDTFDQDQ
jgi:ribonuclease H-related protein